jgi:hypothetical protein
MVQMQHANQIMQSMVGRTPSRKRRRDTQREAKQALDEWTKKQHKAPRVQQVGYDERKQQPLSEISNTYKDFFGFSPPPLSRRIQCTICGQKGHHFEVCLNRHIFCSRCEHYGPYLGKCSMKKLTPLEIGVWLFKRQVVDDTISQAMGSCSLNGFPTDQGNWK